MLYGVQGQHRRQKNPILKYLPNGKRYAYTFLIQCKLQLRASFFLLNSRSFCSFKIVKLLAWDRSLTTNLIAWNKCTSQHIIVVAIMLCANHLGNFILLFSSQQFKNNLLH
jgi:hypothetical protein